ncbi:hypothetical protein [Shivajiella indica]|uniref:Transglutaminase-like domain-containing protein n=1 Tax=Shivajiella indica TaxID=872115 RepID=A0ABW5B678_9BACT
MKSLIIFLLVLLIPFSNHALTENGEKELQFSSEEFISYWDSVSPKFNKLRNKLEKDYKKFDKSEKFLKMVFYRSQLHLLYDYYQYSTVEELIESGKFDCVSGSFLMAAFLDFYGFDYQIIETSHHVFLLVELDKQQIILESTDSFNGFISDKNEVASYLAEFKSDAKNNTLYLHPDQRAINSLINPSIYRTIDLKELKGLEYFNKAIYYNNQKNLKNAFEEITKAESYYASERILTLKRLIQTQLSLAVNY